MCIRDRVGSALDALAQAPQLLNYQGRLTDANGAPRNGSFLSLIHIPEPTRPY